MSNFFATLWTIACWAPLSMGFSRQEYCSGLPCPPPGHPFVTWSYFFCLKLFCLSFGFKHVSIFIGSRNRTLTNYKKEGLAIQSLNFGYKINWKLLFKDSISIKMVETIALLWKYMYLLIYQVNLLFPLGFLEVFLC